MSGLVQGVGFRPFVARLAKQCQQMGWVANTHAGVTIEIEGTPAQQQLFLNSLNTQLPPFADIKLLSVTPRALKGYQDFHIKASTAEGKPSLFVLPDIATCPACIQDIFDVSSRYYRYPFTSCCNCGPRYSIMSRQPYDREHSSMAEFNICPACQQDYQDNDNRRFHAQTIACAACGPRLRLQDESGYLLAEADSALLVTSKYLRAGKIIAAKGIGGYQLLVDATNPAAVERLRERKQRAHKPFALMVADMATAQQLCVISTLEQTALTSPAAPIALLMRRETEKNTLLPARFPQLELAEAVTFKHPLLGIMLPHSPMHHLLLHYVKTPLVATSGNRQNEPICIDDTQAITRLTGVADYFLSHNRLILRPLDDSVIRVINTKPTVLRRARGYTPLPIALNKPMPDTLAVGGQLKNTVAISHAQHAVLSQHLGDLDSMLTQQQFQTTLTDLQQFYGCTPTRIMHDLHDGYSSSQFSAQQSIPTHPVQHHYAHVLSCMAEHGLQAPALGVAWDGSGLGSDGTLWGGEFLLINPQGFQRYAHFRSFALPGGHKAIQEPRRAALGLLYEIAPDYLYPQHNLHFSAQERSLLYAALSKQLNCPRTSSVGRLFDAVASLLGVCHINHYEGQAAMALEMKAMSVSSAQHYPFELRSSSPIIIDWQMTLEKLLDDIHYLSIEHIATLFHNTLAEIILSIALKADRKTVILSGGCFQNALLVEKAVHKLTAAGFTAYCHEKVPPNDGGLALGQLLAMTPE
ncbi:MAG: carbamoyltransferase HypF [Methylococcales bacterium]|nr:carbamoyltransferase HypF [Methylococcales bacterium]